MPYKIRIEDNAKREIKRLPGNMRQRVRGIVARLAQAPRPPDSQQMRTPEDFQLELRRIRIDTWRVV
uniref:mRNA interferase RelE/StbE n=1 Tax=Candidatus Kentrum sp. FM TaxID=2126340 RepID=A0A450S7B0_9GAMM|nr:MAG: mRNA interferase RelE/StbE [Candidatus Kentron sp. FM]VFJ48874.1 MAG: mRNA interferase RelE/StbE [Candidatus Kentron sp. FM]VFK11280.1 MAG: mRNA interferase RelE/StbE [Candidatus Kentron sp. FM]